MPTLIVVKKLAAALDTTIASLMEELEQGVPDEDEVEPPKKKAKKKLPTEETNS